MFPLTYYFHGWDSNFWPHHRVEVTYLKPPLYHRAILLGYGIYFGQRLELWENIGNKIVIFKETTFIYWLRYTAHGTAIQPSGNPKISFNFYKKDSTFKTMVNTYLGMRTYLSNRFFLVSALLRDCSLCWDLWCGTWLLHLTRPC